MNAPYGAELPYDGSSGWAGSETSRQRAVNADESGVTGERQRRTLDHLHRRGDIGLTWRELSNLQHLHHGVASGALSDLHKAGRICRLSETRDRCKVYVLPEYVGDRPIEPHGSTKAAAARAAGDALAAAVEAYLNDDFDLSYLTLDSALDDYRKAVAP